MWPISFALAVPAAFAAGVIYSRYVISEAQSIKAHVTDEISAVRSEIRVAMQNITGKI